MPRIPRFADVFPPAPSRAFLRAGAPVVAAWLVCAQPAAAQTTGLGVCVDVPAGGAPSSLVAFAPDASGFSTLMVANYASGTISRITCDARGGVVTRQDLACGAGPRAVVSADVTGDGLADLVSANAIGNSVSVLRVSDTGRWYASENFAAGSGPRALAVADLDGDRMNDLVVADYFGGVVSLLRNDGTGRFPSRVEYVTGSGPSAVAVADVNGDGRPDIVVTNASSGTMSVLIGDGAGGFAPAVRYSTGASPSGLAVGDLNNDGFADIVTANMNASTVSVFLGDGSGTFRTRTDIATGKGPGAVLVTDADGDGRADIVTANTIASTVSVLHGTGGGAFSGRTDLRTGSRPAAIAAVDLNGDGRPDLLTANSGAKTVTIDFGSDAGAYGAAAEWPAGGGVSAIVTGSFDDVPGLDVIAANYDSSCVSIVHGDGHGGFSGRTRFACGDGPLALVAGDFDGDTHPDVAVANSGSGTVLILHGGIFGGFDDRTDLAVESGPSGLAYGDVIGDETGDLMVANQGDNSVSVLGGLYGGGFAQSVAWGAGGSPRAVAFGDLNSDGAPDLVVANFNSRSVSVLLSTGRQGFRTPVEHAVPGQGPCAVRVADFNGDHYLDLAIANYGTNNVTVLHGDGTGGFSDGATFDVGAGPRALALGDVNGDGIADLVTANEAGNSVSVLLGDGTGSFALHADFPVGLQPRAVAIADMDGDGQVDILIGDGGGAGLSVLLRRARTTVGLAVAPAPAVTGAPVTLAASVAPVADGAGRPSGAVRFFRGTTHLGDATLVDGVATLTVAALPPGTCALSAAYTGDARFAAALSPAVTQYVFECSASPTAGVAPAAAFEGDPVRVRVRGMGRVTAVKFGGVPAAHFSVQLDSVRAGAPVVSVVAYVPTGALSGPVEVDGDCGVAFTSEMFETRRTFAFSNARTPDYACLAGIGWPMLASARDTAGVPVGALGLPGAQGRDWRVETWDAAANAYVAADRLVPGRGYWVQSRDPWQATLTGAAVPNTTRALPLLARGWHQLGNPFTAAVDVVNLRVLKHGLARPFPVQTDVQSTVFVWDAATRRHRASATIPGGAMFWVRRLSITSAESLLVDPPSSSSAGPAPADPGPAPDWSARLVAAQAGGARSEPAYVGLAPIAEGESHPRSALAPPSSPGEALTLRVTPARDASGDEWSALYLPRDASPAWDVVIEHARAPGEVSIELAPEGAPGGLHAVLRDPATGVAVALAPGAPATFAASGAARRLRLEFAPVALDAPVVPREEVRAYPTPFTGATGFRFVHARPATLRVTVLDIAGRAVAALERRDAPAGEDVLVWDGRGSDGAPAPPAVYFARCTCGALAQVLRVVRLP